MSYGIKIEGAKQVLAAIEQIPAQYRTTAEFQILGSGAKPIAKKAKSNAPTGSGSHAGMLKKSIAMNVKGKPGFRTARIGPKASFGKVVGQYTRGKRKGKDKRKNPQYYSHLIELGTAHSPAQPFLKPAVDQASSEVFEAMAKGFDKAMDRIAKRIAKKGGRR